MQNSAKSFFKVLGAGAVEWEEQLVPGEQLWLAWTGSVRAVGSQRVTRSPFALETRVGPRV